MDSGQIYRLQYRILYLCTMKKSWRQTLQFGLLIALLVTVVFNEWNPLERALMVGTTAGILFGGIFYTFYAGKEKNKGLGSLLINGMEERVRMREGVSHFHKGEDIGGMLYFTDGHLVFMSHTMSWKKHQLQIPIELVEDAEEMELYGHAKRGLKLKLSNGQSERFSTPNPKRWIQKIEGEMEGNT